MRQLLPGRAHAHDDLSAGENPFLAELKNRQRKRAIQRQNKRIACDTSGSVEQLALKRKGQRLTAESFKVCAHDPSELEDRLLEELGAANSSSASLSESNAKGE